MRLDAFVEEKEPEWIKQRTREKKLARKLEKEKERIRQMVEEEKERQRRAEEREREQAAMVRRHLGLSPTSRRGRRHSGGSDRSSEMSPVPSNVSSPSPPPPQIFHEVQESVPFPFATPALPPALPIGTSTGLEDAVPSSSIGPAEIPKDQSIQHTGDTATPPSSVSEIASTANTAKKLPRLKLKFKGLTVRTPSPNTHSGSPPVSKQPDGEIERGAGASTIALGQSLSPLADGLVATANGSAHNPSRQSGTIATPRLPQNETTSKPGDARPLSPKSTSTPLPQEGDANSIPPAVEEVMNRMQTLLNDQDAVPLSSQDTVNVGIAVDVTIAKVATASTIERDEDEGRLSTSIKATSPNDDGKDSESKMASSVAPPFSRQDEEDEALVEVLGGLDAVSGSGSSGGFRRNADALSSAGSLSKGKAPDRFPGIKEDALGDPSEDLQQHRTTVPAFKLTLEQQTLPMDNKDAALERQRDGPNSAFDLSSVEEPRSDIQADFQTLIDDELEPVTFEDTQGGTWKAIYKGEHGDPANKGKQRASLHKGKERAKDLSLQIRSVNNSDPDDNSRWAQSPKVIQVKGITGPTATDTESPSVQSPDTRSVSPAPISLPMAQSPGVQTVEAPSGLRSGSTSIGSASARLSLQRRRQNEALYAALAASFLNRCGSSAQSHPTHDEHPGIQAGLGPQSMWPSLSSSSRGTSDTPPESYTLQRRAGMTTCDPRDVFGKTEPVVDTSTGHVKAEGDSKPVDEEVLENDRKDANEELPTDDENEMAEVTADQPIISSPEPETIVAMESNQQTSRSQPAVSNSARSSASRAITIEEEDSEIEGTLPPRRIIHVSLLIGIFRTVLGTTWHRQGRASRNKRKIYSEMIPIDQLDLSPPKRHRTIRESRGTSHASHRSTNSVLDLNTDDDDDEPIYISGRNPWIDPTNVEVVIPIRRRPFSPTPIPIPHAGPNLKIKLNLGPYRQ